MSDTLGEFEQLLLLAVKQRANEATSAEMRSEIRDRTGRRVAPGALYTTMARLEKRGLVSTVMRAETADGGRRIKVYGITEQGERALSTSYRQFARMTEGLVDELGAGRSR